MSIEMVVIGGVGAEKYRYRGAVSVGVSKRSKQKFITHKRKI